MIEKPRHVRDLIAASLLGLVCVMIPCVSSGQTGEAAGAAAARQKTGRFVLTDVQPLFDAIPENRSRAGIEPHSEKDAKGGEVVMFRTQPPGYRMIVATKLGLMRFAGDIPMPVSDLDVSVGVSASGNEFHFLGKVTLFDIVFDSQREYPLAFKFVKSKGFVYLAGRGSITTLKDRRTYRLGHNDTIDTWLPLIGSSDQLDRESAAQALGWLARTQIERDRALRVLIPALKDKAMEVRRNAAEALGRIGDPQAAESLAVMQMDESDWVRQAAEASTALIRRTTPSE